MNLVFAVLVLGILIMFHELGHFLAAKAVGVRVYEFAIGFGPKLFSWRRGETDYSVRLLLLLGGFTRMAGMEPGEEGSHDPLDEGRKFNRKSVGQRSLVILAGPLLNYVIAMLLFFLVFAAVGLHERVGDQAVVWRVQPGQPAALAGIEPGDRVLSVNGESVPDWDTMVGLVQGSLGKPLEIAVQRDGRTLNFRVTPAPNRLDPRLGMIGIEAQLRVVRFSVPEAAKMAISQTVVMSGAWFSSIALMIQRKVSADLVGPVGIVRMVAQATAVGPAQLLSLAGALSVTLGIINLLPFPALDGGRLVFLLIERLRGRPLDPIRENFIHFIGFALLMLLALLITFHDIQRLVA